MRMVVFWHVSMMEVVSTSETSVSIYWTSLLGGVVVSVLATGPKGRGFKPDRGDGFLRAIKIHNTPSFGWEIKPEVP
jgi:hypothetical protein